MNDLSGQPGAAQLRGVLGYLRKAFQYSPRHLIHLGLIVAAYAALEATRWSDSGSRNAGPNI